jgi:hypothetical protein
MVKTKKEFTIPIWLVDGFIGVLALVIFNFLLYILNVLGVGGIVSQLESTMGYFTLNSLLELNLSPASMLLGLIIIFAISFILGMLIAGFVRKRKRYNKNK